MNEAVKRVKIYQAELETPYKFFGLKIAQRKGFSEDHYKLVYEDSIGIPEHTSNEEFCEQLYALFNADTKRPDNYKGHSLSMSDVVVIDDKAYYCDNIGFVEIDWNRK